MSHYLNQKILGIFVKTNGLLSRPLFSGLGHVLCFHRVFPANDTFRIQANSGLEISPGKIEYIIRFFLQKKYEVISLENLYEILIKNIKPKKRFIVLTFDDGYADNYTYVYPIMKKLGIPFAIYLTTDFPEKKAILWWYMLENLLLGNQQVSFYFNGKEYSFDTSTKERKEDVFLKIRKLILENQENYEELFRILFPDYIKQKKELVEQNALSWEQVIELSKNDLVTIGAHTMSHSPLNKLSEAEAKLEIEQSKKLIEEKINKSVNHFAYPYGGTDTCGEREFLFVKQAGFKTATTLHQGNIFGGYKNFVERLPRIPLGESTDMEKLINITNGIHHFGNNFFNRVILK